MAIPGGDIYGWRRLDAHKAFNEAKLKLARRRQNVLSQYGYQAEFDENGRVKNMGVDPYSQHGGLQTMLRGHSQELDQADERAMERGVFGPGLGAQQGAEARHRQAGQTTDFARNLSNMFADLSGEHTDIERGYQRELSTIDHEAARQAIEDQAFTVADYPPDEEPVEEEESPAAILAKSAGKSGATLRSLVRARALAAQRTRGKKKRPPMGVRKARR